MMDENRLSGQVALITGAGSGLGRAYAIDLARAGARLMLNDLPAGGNGAAGLDDLAASLRAAGSDVAVHRGDMSCEANARGAVRATVEHFGAIHVLVNNAGSSRKSTAQSASTADMRDMLNLHVMGQYWTMNEALAPMRERDYGRIILTTSGTALFGSSGHFAYATAKAAIIGMVKAASQENEDKAIRVNAISPLAYSAMASFFEKIDPRYTADRLAAARVAPIVTMLAHPDCPLNGEILTGTGGRAARAFVATVPGYASDTLSCDEALDHVDTIMDSSQWFDFKNSIEQYRLIP